MTDEAAQNRPEDRVVIFDTTLRDGQQTPGIDFSVQDKIVIAEMLDELGIDPAVASGAFVTTVTDVVGFFAFLGIAALWLV